jgi:hypothetical protein
MSNCQKVEKVIYEVGIESLLRLHSIWSRKLRFCRTPDSVQDRISGAQSTSKSHNSSTTYHIEVCKYSWKAEKPLCNFYVELHVRFWS